MEKIVPGIRVTEFDKAMISSGRYDSSALIDGAAREMLEVIAPDVKNKKILILVGSGNNGADGLQLALDLRNNGEDVSLFYRMEGRTEENIKRRKIAEARGIPTVDTLSGFGVIIDAVYGASFHPPLREEDGAFFDEVNELHALKIACDVPSGYAFKADKTVTFTFPKLEMIAPSKRRMSGRIILRNPGFSEDDKRSVVTDTYMLSPERYVSSLPKDEDYKNSRGHLLILGGSECWSGAPRLAARAAFHAGAGLVTIKTGKDAYDAVSNYESAIVTTEHVDYDRFQAAVFGPGWGKNSDRSFLSFPKNMVLDASALDMIGKGDKFSRRAILTPHYGEYRRLVSRLGLPGDIRTVARTLEAVLVVKGEDTFISDGINIYVLDRPNGSLGVAGSGDVLTGIIGAFLASGRNVIDAAVSGVLLHSIAGENARKRYGAFDSHDLTDEVGRAL